MRLLTTRETQDNKAQETALSILRTKELSEQEQRARFALNKADTEFKETLSKNQLEWAKKQEEHINRLKEIDQEVVKLEEKRRVLLLPIKEIEKKSQEQLIKNEEDAKELKKRSEELDDLKTLFEDKLDSLGSKEQDLNKRQQSLLVKESGLESQVDQFKTQTKALSEQIATFVSNKELAEKDINERKTAVTLVEISLESKKVLQDRKEEDLNLWAASLKGAELEIEKKRKEIMRPVEDIIQEAKADRELSKSSLEEALRTKIEAENLKQNAKEDYNSLLATLLNRENTISTEELRLKELVSETQRKSNILAGQQADLKQAAAELIERENTFKKSANAFETYRVDKNKELDAKIGLLLTKENNVKQVLVEIKSEKFVNIQTLDQIKEERKAQELKSKILISQQDRINKLIKDQEEVEFEALAKLKELSKERESFALWRTEAEDVVAKREIETKRLAKVLAQKENKLTRQEKFLSELNIKLKDERGVLDRAWNELKSKYPPK